MKEEFKNEIELLEQLDKYKVEVPKHRLNEKLTPYQRFIRYLASPTKNPLEEVTATSTGFLYLKVLPLVGGLLIALLQGLLLH